MKLKNKKSGITVVILIVITIIVLFLITTVIVAILNNKSNENPNDVIENENSNKEAENPSNENPNNQVENESNKTNNIDFPLIPLNIGKKESIIGAELISINDYQIKIPNELVKIGYDIIPENNTIRIKAKDNSYECVLLQLSDSYVMPTEEEDDGFYETNEYKEWYEEDYSFDDETYDLHWDKYDEISTNYYKKLGYTAKNCPNYVLTDKEMKSIIGEYVLAGESNVSVKSGLFPGHESYNSYEWGKTTMYTIPKYYNSSMFGEDTSDISVCIYLFEYYDSSKVDFNVALWTL